MRHQTIVGAFLSVVALCTMSGCALISQVAQDSARQPPMPLVDSVDDWESFPHCPGGPETEWRLVDGFPVKALEAAGLAPECGDSWADDEGEHFENVTEFRIDEDGIAALGDALVAVGYVELWNDFAPAPDGAAAAPVGAMDFYLDGLHEGDFTRLAIELYANGGSPQSYTAFIDYLSPETRALPL
jgi:hypothetical protein